jgi:hypothetical protein
MIHRTLALCAAVAALNLALPSLAAAQSAGEEPGTAATAEPGPDSTMIADAEAGASPVEQAGRTYRFVGLRYRGIIVPKFMMNLFGDGGSTVYVNGIGPEFNIRKDGFEYSFAAWWAGYGMGETPFKSSSDTQLAWEIVESKLNVIYLTADFLWSQEFTPQFSLNYGLGAGFGFVFGDLFRTQAYPVGDENDPESYRPCVGQGNPDGTFCGVDNNHYAGYTEPSWANGGSKPIIFPWLSVQTGIRFKPHRNFVARFDAGFGITGFFIGIGADYGL